MAAIENEADDKLASVDVDSILSRVGRRPLTFNKTRLLYKAPEFIKRLTGEETVQEGTTVQLETKVSGLPRPVLRWYKDAEEIVDHPRIHVEGNADGVYVFTIENVNKGDEAAYRCRAENEEGISSSIFYLHVKVKPRSPKRSSKHLTKRSVSYPPMFPTIVEKVEEEEKEAKEAARSPPSPLTQLYDGLTLQTRHTWPKFLGDWAYVENVHRNGGSIGSETDSETGDGHSLESIEHDDVFSDESCEKSTEGGSASFYVSSNEVTPETPDSINGDIKRDVNILSEDTSPISNGISTCTDAFNRNSDVDKGNSHVVSGNSDVVNANSDVVNANSDVVSTHSDVNAFSSSAKSEENNVKTEPNNNEPKVTRGNRDMHLPLSNGLVSSDKPSERKEEAQNVSKKKKDKDSSLKKIEERKKNGEKIKVSKRVDDKEKSEKSVKKADKEKEKVVKKSDLKEKVVKKENTGMKKDIVVKKSEIKDDAKLKSKSNRDVAKSAIEKKTLRKTEKDKTTDSPKRKSESKVKKVTCDYITNPDPPILGTARPLVFTNLASKISAYTCTGTGSENDNNPLRGADVYMKTSIQSEVGKQCKDVNGDVVCYHDKKDLAIPIEDVPFGRYFEEFIFVVCLFTFLALCIGIPTETFVLVILGMHFFYSMVTILGLC